MVKGLLERFITHFGLGSSLEEPRGLICLLGGGRPCFWGLALQVTWEALAWEVPNWEALLSGWDIALSPRGVLPAWEQPDCLPTLLFWEACEALSLAEHLTAGATLGLTAWETSLSTWESAIYWGSLEIGTLCLGESTVHWGRWGVACLGNWALCPGERTVCWGSLGDSTLCLGESTAWLLPEGKPGCLIVN